MGKTEPLSLPPEGGSRRDDSGGELLKELEALSQALFNAGDSTGRPPWKEIPSSPYLASISAARRHEPVSPLIDTRGKQKQSPSPHYIGSPTGRGRESPQDPVSTRIGTNGRKENWYDEPPLQDLDLGPWRGTDPQNPSLRGMGGRRVDPKNLQIVNLAGARNVEAKAPDLGRLGTNLEGGRRPSSFRPVSPLLGATRGLEPNSPHLRPRRSEEIPNLLPLDTRTSEELKAFHLSSRRRSDSFTLPGPRSRWSENTPRLASTREETGIRIVNKVEESSKLYESDDRGAPSTLRRPRTRPVNEAFVRSGGITLSSSAAGLNFLAERPPIPTRPKSLPAPSQLNSPGKRIYRLDVRRENVELDYGSKPWHSFESNRQDETNFQEDYLLCSKKLEVRKEKKKSLWNWKPLRAIAHIGQQRFNCMFTAYVHGIEGLPAVMNGLRLAVSWKRKESQTQTTPARVFQGSAEFEEALNLKSVVYGTKTGTHGMKYESRNFELAVFAPDIDDLVFGKHRLDLSQLLPESSEDMYDDGGDRGWTASFKLVGKATGGSLVVTFGCQLLDKYFQPTSTLSSARFGGTPLIGPLRSYNSLPGSPPSELQENSTSASHFSPSRSNLPPELKYMTMDYLNLDERRRDALLSFGRNSQKSSQRGQSQPDFNTFQGVPKRLTFDQPVNMVSSPKANQPSVEEEQYFESLESGLDEEDYSKYKVVLQGHEVSTILDVAPPAEHDPLEADEDTVEGLAGADAEEQEVDSAEDAVVVKSQVGANAEDQEALLQDLEPSDNLSQQMNSEILVVDNTDEMPTELESPPGESLSTEEDNPKSWPTTEESQTEWQAAENGKNGHKIQEDIQGVGDVAKVQNQLSSGVVKKLTDMSRLSLADCPASLVLEQGVHQEDSTFGDKEEEKEINVVIEEIRLKDNDQSQVVKQYLAPDPTGPGETMLKEGDDLGDDFDLVADEFLRFLGEETYSVVASSECVEDSPRALLLQQFEQEALIEGGLGCDLRLRDCSKSTLEGSKHDDLILETVRTGDRSHKHSCPEGIVDTGWGSEEDSELSSIMEVAEAELQKATQIICGKTRARIVENAETKAVVQE